MNRIEWPFARIGARVKVEHGESLQGVGAQDPAPVQLDVRRDARGEYFLIRKAVHADLEVLDCRPADRHLLLLARVRGGGDAVQKPRFLLGHDERHWFVAAIPESTPVSTVRAAKQALKPEPVTRKEHGLKASHRHRRVNKAWLRQGEWFFVPVPDADVSPFLVLKKEPLRRAQGKPHICDELYREGGETVYVSRLHPNGLTEEEYGRLGERERSRQVWRTMRRNPRVLVRGHVRHSDHATLFLDCWHEVHMNTETRARAMLNVAFLD